LLELARDASLRSELAIALIGSARETFTSWERGSPEPLMSGGKPKEERLWRAALPADTSRHPPTRILFEPINQNLIMRHAARIKA